MSQVKPTASHCACLIVYSFALPLLMDWTESDLYWHAALRHIVPVVRKFNVPACYFSEELFESSFKEVKKVLRDRSNHGRSRDLLVVRAMGEALESVNGQYGGRTHRCQHHFMVFGGRGAARKRSARGPPNSFACSRSAEESAAQYVHTSIWALSRSVRASLAAFIVMQSLMSCQHVFSGSRRCRWHFRVM